MAAKGSAVLSSCMQVGKAARSSTLLPFLYQTQTLQRLSLSKDRHLHQQFQGNTVHRALATSSTKTASRDYIPFGNSKTHDGRRKRQTPKFFEDRLDEAGPDLDEPRQPRDSTITSSEHAVFTRIFDKMVSASADPVLDSEDDDYIFPEDQREPDSNENLNSILVSASAAAKNRAERKEKRDAYQSLEEHRKYFISRYPPPLREAAAKASGILARQEAALRIQQPSSSEGADIFGRMIREERRRELVRVEGLLRGAETDFQLWDVLEKEVFSMIKKIDGDATFSNKPKTVLKAKRGRPKKITEGAQPVLASVPAEATTDAEVVAKQAVVPALAIVGPNYPSHCLLALRLLHEQFPSSPLALSLLPTIKRLGPTSYVLGASTALYNELLSVQWDVYGDMRAMANLLTEMQEQGLEFDERTESVLEQPAWEREAVRSGERESSLRALWEMEEMKGGFARLQALRKVVRKRLMELDVERELNGEGRR
ncbi:MAG: hypothetical protein M1830_002189 [Pleopsidium flavum]|nr:MAG: hypothetical protein M1830_002189 [Pleopsidium flavum]